jgi:chitinase
MSKTVKIEADIRRWDRPCACTLKDEDASFETEISIPENKEGEVVVSIGMASYTIPIGDGSDRDFCEITITVREATDERH